MKAGVIPYYVNNDGVIQMLFMKPSNPLYGGSKYQIAKGMQEGDEFPLEIAKREGQEELGLKLDNIQGDIIFAYKSKMYSYDLYVYVAKIRDKEDFDPFDKEVGEIAWLTVKDDLPKMRKIQQEAIQKSYYVIQIMEEIF